MTDHGIPLDKAELLSALLEGILYGFSLLMFGGTIRVLLYRQSTGKVNRKMFTVACLLLVTSTAHLAIHIVRVMFGLVLYRDTYPGGPIAYFSDVSQWTFVTKNHLYTVQTLMGDGVLLYRCYVVWQSKLVMILPVLLWLGVCVTGFTATHIALHVEQSDIFDGTLSKLITVFWALALATNLLTTFLLVFRIWHVHRKATKLLTYRESQLQPILHIIVDSGVIYSLTLVVALVCFVTHSNGQYVILDMAMPIISISFYLVIIRVRLATRASQLSASRQIESNSTDHSHGAERRHKMQVHITTLTKSNAENGQHSSMLLAPIDSKSRPREIKFGSIAEAV